MSNKKRNHLITLMGLDIEGEWNVPLLKNAAEISGAAIQFAESKNKINDLNNNFNNIVACETTHKSCSVFEFPAISGHTALLVGNEQKGIAKNILKNADHVISIPMHGKGLSSVNVAVAAAICLYVLNKDWARKNKRKPQISQPNVDILLSNPENPYEIGSLLRSIWAFGWRHVFLRDDHKVWFTKDRKILLEGRAAARREKNRIVVVPADRIHFEMYDQIYCCNQNRHGTPLSRMALINTSKILLAYGTRAINTQTNIPIENVYVDFCIKDKVPCFRHEASIFLAVIAEMTKRRLCGYYRGY